MTRPIWKAPVLRHPARLHRCWLILQEGTGHRDYFAILHSRANGEEARTETGSLWQVRDLVRNLETHRGVPIAPFISEPPCKRRAS